MHGHLWPLRGALRAGSAGVSRRPRDFVAAVLVAGLGLLALYVSSLGSSRVLSWSDEFVYAVLGRNVAEGIGAYSNYYDSRSIVEAGYPLGDVHLPGFPLLIAAAFMLAGVSSSSALLPAAVCFVASGVVLHAAAAPRIGAVPALLVASCFFVFPGTSGYAHTAMPELPLLLASCSFLSLWLRAWDEPRLSVAVGMALIVGLGATLRETFLVYAPPAAYALSCGATSRRWRGVTAFCVVLGSYLALVLLPLHASRAPFPRPFNEVVASQGGPAVFSASLRNALANVSSLFELGRGPFHQAFLLTFSVTVLVPLVLLGTSRRVSRSAALAAWAGLATYAALLPLYSLQGSGGHRHLLLALPPALMAAGAGVARLPRPWGALTAVAVLFGLLTMTVSYNEHMRRDRVATLAADAAKTRAVLPLVRRVGASVVVAPRAFSLGWEAYPVNVIWQGADSPEQLAALERHLWPDVIVLPSSDADALLRAVSAGEVRGSYALVAEAGEDLRVLLSAGPVEPPGAAEP